VTSMPNGKWRSILFTGGFVRCSERISFSSTVPEDVLIFLLRGCGIRVSFWGEVGDGRHDEGDAYHPVLCVSGASSSSVFDASEEGTYMLVAYIQPWIRASRSGA
jgi:hypothetical protein